MKAYVNKKTIKNLIIIIFIITILSALVPVSVHAKTNTENGGKILTPIEDFALFLGDKVMQWLQETFMSKDSIEVEEGKWEFKYSPAIIFSGEVPAFDINFINPNTNTREDSGMKDWLTEQRKEFSAQATEYTWEEYRKLGPEKGKECKTITETISEAHIGKVADVIIKYYTQDNYLHVYFFEEFYDGDTEPVRFFYLEKSYEITEEFLAKVNTTKYGSIAFKLQSTIASWYNALRRIALVGLLSVLVYIGIRIVTSSSAGDKAKYKAMIKDWIAAICILFTLHYIMSITITVVNEISSIFATGESDVLVDTLRGEIFSEKDRGIILAKTIMYLVIVVLTVTFTVQYLKRVIFMAFYTLIAPLITLTYPLDKIKDGQAQAFTMWIREYVYTALIQVIHLIIYTVMVGSALDIVSMYPLYAIIVMLFIKKADGIIKKMFGFDKAETVGTLGAAATGALVVNALNKIARKRRLEKKQLIGKCRRSRENKCKNYTK